MSISASKFSFEGGLKAFRFYDFFQGGRFEKLWGRLTVRGGGVFKVSATCQGGGSKLGKNSVNLYLNDPFMSSFSLENNFFHNISPFSNLSSKKISSTKMYKLLKSSPRHVDIPLIVSVRDPRRLLAPPAAIQP